MLIIINGRIIPVLMYHREDIIKILSNSFILKMCIFLGHYKQCE